MNKCKTCGHETKEIEKTLKIGNWEYETEDHDKGKKLSDIEIPKGWELWDKDDCFNIYNSHKKELNLEACWFFIKQPIREFEGKYVARFDAYSDWVRLSCGRVHQGSNAELGVRFKRKCKK